MYDNADPVTQPDPRVLARRVAERRLQLGLSEGALATQAGMAPRYLQHLLSAGVDFDPGGFVRIAGALHLSYDDLLEGRTGGPPGQGEPAAHPALLHLTELECWDRLGSRGVGRIALPVEPSPGVFPVNYAIDAQPADTRSIVYRTEPGSAAAPPRAPPSPSRWTGWTTTSARAGASWSPVSPSTSTTRSWRTASTSATPRIRGPATTCRCGCGYARTTSADGGSARRDPPASGAPEPPPRTHVPRRAG